MSPRCPRMQRWGERGHTPRRVLQRGRGCEATSGLVDPEWAVALRSALPAGHCQRDTLPAPVGARIRHRRREAGDITQLPSRPQGQRGTPARTQTPDSSRRPRRHRCLGRGRSSDPPPSLPAYVGLAWPQIPAPGKSRPGTVAQQQSLPSPGSRLLRLD